MNNFSIFFVVIIFFNVSCTLVDKKIALYSVDPKIQSANKIIVKNKKSEEISKRHCNRVILLIPFSKNKLNFDVADEIFDENKDFNALQNVQFKSDAVIIPPFYMSICHEVKGTLIGLDPN